MKPMVASLWFDDNAEEARDFYVSVFKDSEVLDTAYYTEVGPGKEGTVVTVSFKLNGMEFVGINGGPHFTFSEAVSFVIPCDDQGEVDYYWEHLLADGGEESQCGWLKDKFGLSWQVVPTVLNKLILDPDRKKANRAMEAMLKMVKLDIATLQEAFDGN